MEYSIVNGETIKAFPGGKGICNCCGTQTIAKCGTKNVYHWARVSNKKCDPWWENETEWHRNWKHHFPKDWHEIDHFDTTGEKHRADLKTPDGLVVEFQNSPISYEEMESREAFYKNMVWVVNAETFKHNLDIKSKLPDPRAKFLDDVVFNIGTRSKLWGFHRPSESTPEDILFVAHHIEEIKEEIDANYRGHHLFTWVKPRTVWYRSKCPVYLDLNQTNGLMLELVKYRDMFFCFRVATQEVFLQRVKFSLFQMPCRK